MFEVATKEELKAARDQGAGEIVVLGDLAKRLRAGKRIKKAGALGLGGSAVLIAAGVVAMPLTGGVSLPAAVSALGATGAAAGIGAAGGVAASGAAASTATIGLITAAGSIAVLGVGLVVAVWRDYEKIEFTAGLKPRLVLRKKAKKS